MKKTELFKEFELHRNPILFEDFVVTLFTNLEYIVPYDIKSGNRFFDMSLINPINMDERYICKTKYFSTPTTISNKNILNIMDFSDILKSNEKGLFITTAICTEQCREEAKKKNIFILDITNLKFLTKNNDELYQLLLGSLDFSISDFETIEPEIKFSIKEKKYTKRNKIITWENKLKDITPGNKSFSKYEKNCISILKILFSDYLNIWEEQTKTNSNLYRFDLICKIKSNITDDFFTTLNSYFNTKYIIFEFKNHSEKLTQREIYTTEKYLYDKALRKVAIIISRKGVDENALKAIKGSLREQGKIILSLTDYDLIEMLKMHYDKDNPTDYLSEKLDRLLIELEK